SSFCYSICFVTSKYFSYTFLDFKKLVFDLEMASLNTQTKKRSIKRESGKKINPAGSNKNIVTIEIYIIPIYITIIMKKKMHDCPINPNIVDLIVLLWVAFRKALSFFNSVIANLKGNINFFFILNYHLFLVSLVLEELTPSIT